jgi:glycosyltransferase involved in cell wall biosynthesis
LSIGINALYLIPGAVGGTEIYLRSLLDSLAEIDSVNRYFVYTNRETGDQILPPGFQNFSAVIQPVSARYRPARIVWEQTGLLAAMTRNRLDVLLNPGFTAPLFALSPSVTVFHDMQHKRHPEYFRPRDLPFWRLLLWLAAHQSQRLIAVSHNTKRDMLHYYRIPARKIRAIPHGVDARFFGIGRERPATPQKLILTVSTSHPHKNLGRLVRAFSRFRSTHPRYRLTIAGLNGLQGDALQHLIRELGVADCVRLTGWIPREELYQLFGQASAFIYPSRFEGFGMSVLEALAAALPMACSNIAPLADIVGNAALLFDPDDEHAIQAAMCRVVDDEELRRRLAAAGPARASRFPWQRTAKATLNVLNAAVRDSRRNGLSAMT